ncbi:ABC transporter substrate-binding protein [Flavonifractor sp. An112]|uniref:ABC transporter substrate-binding protein n=1 Tax=Flavonifractor sp. An112 TaxID=1965544 RepID=UPI0013020F07|nr:ABC transporter substrate-binding protein [Flavonifractor sp. An112]
MKLRNAIALMMVMLIMTALAACVPAEITEQTLQPQQTEKITDSRPDTDRSGNPITLPEQVDSIISMAPSATQTLLDLGLKDKLVAVDTYSAMYFGLEDLPTFDMMEPDTEQMAVLGADLIFTTGMSASDGVDPFKPLRDIGVCVADIPSASSIDTMLEDTRFIAACVGAQETCEELIAQFQKELEQLSDIGAGIQNKKRVVVEIACAPDIYTAGSGTFMNEMLTMIGAENIFGDQEGYLAVTEESVITLNPDIILTMVDYVDDPVAEILGRIGWEYVAAVANGDVYLVNTNAVSLPNLHVIDGMKQMAKMIYPDAYAGIEDPFAGEAAA